MDKRVQVWNPIKFDNSWKSASTIIFDSIAPSWEKKRKKLMSDEEEYENFLNILKRQHAIETGVIEKLYDLNNSITETFIKEGFIESYLQYGDTNVSNNKLMNYLNDHLHAIDFVFDLVKETRPFSKQFIKELHSLVTRHQETTRAIDSLGNEVYIPLKKGEFKSKPNNPKRSDGTIYLYCPPEQVDSEMDQLIEIYYELEDDKISPIIISAWFHHVFTQIHPFQDGNGRIARLLGSLILIKHNLLPLVIKRDDKVQYIDSLELADDGKPENFVEFFCKIQKRSIERALNWPTDSSFVDSSFAEVSQIFSEKIEGWKKERKIKEKQIIDANRRYIFDCSKNLLEGFRKELHDNIEEDLAGIYLSTTYPGDDNDYYYAHQIVEYAKKHDYYFNRSHPKGWFKLTFVISESRRYQLIITIHHYGYDDSTLAIGAFLEFFEPKKEVNEDSIEEDSTRIGEDNVYITNVPLEIDPLTLSVEEKLDDQKLINTIKPYLNDVITLALAQIINELDN